VAVVALATVLFALAIHYNIHDQPFSVSSSAVSFAALNF